MNKIKLLITGLIYLGFSCISNPAFSQEFTPTEWQENVEFLANKIFEVHPDPYRKYSPDEWKEHTKRLMQHIPESDAAAAMEIYRLLAMASDGHTEVEVVAPALRWHWLPIQIKRLSDGWFVVSGDSLYRNTFGKQIIQVNETRVETVVKQLTQFISFDNAIGALDGIGNLMRNAIVLEELGIASRDSVNLTLLDDNERISVTVLATSDPWVTDKWVDAEQVLNPGPEPIYQQFDRNYDFEYLSNEKLVYVWFSSIRDEEDESIKEFFTRVYEFVENNDVNKFVLDLRENSGGNLDLNGPVLHGLISSKKVNYPGGLFVITGRDTYSAAMNLAVLLEKHTHALFVGEPTGATPNHFGDTQKFTLPYSDISVEISELYWQNSNPRDQRPWITPDIPVTMSFNEFIQSRDPVLEAIRRFQPTDSLIANFGPPIHRWNRSNQVGKEIWPSLLQDGN